MGPISAVSTGILVAVIVTAVWLTLNQHRLPGLPTRHLYDLDNVEYAGQQGYSARRRWS
jgi:hypothetical protein